MLIFSKLTSGYWPNIGIVADKCATILARVSEGLDCTEYLAGYVPLKGGGTTLSKRHSRKNSPTFRSAQVSPRRAGSITKAFSSSKD